jgi:hypothetical protein
MDVARRVKETLCYTATDVVKVSSTSRTCLCMSHATPVQWMQLSVPQMKGLILAWRRLVYLATHLMYVSSETSPSCVGLDMRCHIGSTGMAFFICFAGVRQARCAP